MALEIPEPDPLPIVAVVKEYFCDYAIVSNISSLTVSAPREVTDLKG